VPDLDKKLECNNTNYTEGFKITRENNVFTATKGKIRLQAASAEEINELIKKNSK
jgi:hypothetical protein